MNFFDEISKVKEDFPNKHTVANGVKNYDMNAYQIFAIGFFIVCLFLGVIFGNLFATCQTASYYYSDACVVTEFNFSLMIAIWFMGFLVSAFFFAIGHIISLLSVISKKLDKFRD